MGRPKLLYVAAHGTKGRIATLKEWINGKTIANALLSAKNIRYVHFGSCLFGSDANLKYLLKRAKHLKWAAGYAETVDWVDSTLFDIMLWGRIAFRTNENKGQQVHTLVKTLLSQMPAFAKELGFRLQYRFGKNIRSAT